MPQNLKLLEIQPKNVYQAIQSFDTLLHVQPHLGCGDAHVHT